MKRVVLVTLLAIFATNYHSYGQMLEPQEGSNKKWGFVDETGKLIISYKYDLVDGFVEGLAAVSLNGKWGFIDKSGNEVIPLKYGWVNGFSEGLAKVCFNGKYGFIDKTDKVVIPFEYDFAYGFSEKFLTNGPPAGFAMVVIKGKNGYSDAQYGFFDKTGAEVVPVKYTKNRAIRKFNRAMRRHR
jgi:hypothetical protein